ncbi:MAG: hypothetical protein HS132_16855 [Planctomycetia bacterium]|nr:hypothetical protein [Planctomycetia bacterium]
MRKQQSHTDKVVDDLKNGIAHVVSYFKSRTSFPYKVGLRNKTQTTWLSISSMNKYLIFKVVNLL